MSRCQPHLQLYQGQYVPRAPAPSPMLTVDINVMHDAHKSLGKCWQGSRKGIFDATTVDAIADTGCQTCTAGIDILESLSCPQRYLIHSNHKIVGITEDSLQIVGAILLRITIGKRTTRQMVHISKNIRGLFLSKTALIQLGIINDKFPAQTAVSHVMQCKSDGTSTNTSPCLCAARSPTPEHPTSIPFPPTSENVPKLKEWILSAFASSAFNTCTHQSLQEMTGAPVSIRFQKGQKPYAVHTPIPIPHHWKKQVKDDLDRDVRLGIIETVPQGTTTTWCSRMIVTPKKDGKPRRTVDLQRLNSVTERETHHTPSPFNLVSAVPMGKKKTVLDAWNGYHSLPLDPDAKEATTFITEWGRYRYCRAPMGFHASGDAYTRRFDDITSRQVRVARCIDDSLLWDNNVEDSFWHTFNYIKLCADNGIVFNKEKFTFAEDIVEFAGFEITQDGYRPPKRILNAIKDFPVPKNVTDVRSWFGLINQVAYAFSQTETMAPFRELLASKTQMFFWDDTMDALFSKSKEKIVRLVEEGVRSFETCRPTCLATDWSKTGLGYTLSQKHCNCPGPAKPNCKPGHWKLVFAGSRFTRGPETRYAPIEGETLAVVYGLQCCRMFIMGCPELIVTTDHKPLIRILNDRELETIHNPRLLQLKEKTLMYRYRIVHIAGSSNGAPDAASRYPTGEGNEYEACADEQMSLAFAMHQAEEMQVITWNDVRDAAIKDEECTVLKAFIQNGFPQTRSELPEIIRQFWPMRDDLYTIEHVPFRDKKMLIPKPLRSRVLEGLHAAHQGVNGMLANARERLFWPGLDSAIRLTRSQCRQCNEHAPSQPSEPEILTRQPDVPFQQTVMDLCELEGHHFLVYADRFTGWVEVVKPTSTSFRSLRPILLRWFSTFGVPEEISADGGPPFNSSDYDEFLRNWRIRKRQSSAYYPQSNGRAEVAVKTVKRILLGNINQMTGALDTNGATQALLTHRNTPLQGSGISPSVSLYGRPLHDHLPSLQRKLGNGWRQVAEEREHTLRNQCSMPHTETKKQKTTRSLDTLDIGDSVQIQNQHGNKPNRWSNTGVVAETLPHRQYRLIVDGSRRATLRNRRFLRKIVPTCRKIAPAPMSTKIDGRELVPAKETRPEIQTPNQTTDPESLQTLPTPLAHQTDNGVNNEPLMPTPQPCKQSTESHSPAQPVHTQETESTPTSAVGGIRRSTRLKKKPERLDL